MSNLILSYWFVSVSATAMRVSGNQLYYCGAGPHVISKESQPAVVYQLENKLVIFEATVDMPTGRKLKWIASVGHSWLNQTELAAIVNGDRVRGFTRGNHSRLMITTHPSLNGTQYQFGFEDVHQKLVYRSVKITLSIGDPPSIYMRNLAVEGDHGSVSVSGSYQGIPYPSISLRRRDGSKIHKSLYRYDNGWWHLDGSLGKEGGAFTLSASNCFSMANRSFTVNVSPRVQLELSEGTVCEWKGCSNRLIITQLCQDVVIPISVGGFPAPLVRWLRYNREDHQYTAFRIDDRGSFNKTHFFLRAAQLGDSSSYRVRVDNVLGSDKVTFDLEVTADNARVSQCRDRSIVSQPMSHNCLTPTVHPTESMGQEIPCQHNSTMSTTSRAETTSTIGLLSRVTGRDILLSNRQTQMPYVSSKAYSLAPMHTKGIPSAEAPADGPNVNFANVPVWIAIIGIASCFLIGIATILLLCFIIKIKRLNRETEQKRQPKWAVGKFPLTEVKHQNTHDQFSARENDIKSTSFQSRSCRVKGKESRSSLGHHSSKRTKQTAAAAKTEHSPTKLSDKAVPRAGDYPINGLCDRNLSPQFFDSGMINERHRNGMVRPEEREPHFLAGGGEVMQTNFSALPYLQQSVQSDYDYTFA